MPANRRMAKQTKIEANVWELALERAAVAFERRDGRYNAALTYLALRSGWSVGIARTFIHLDCRGLIGMAPNVFGYGRRS